MNTIHCLILPWASLVLLGGIAGPADAAGPAIIKEASLHTPPDSHEPQKALVDVQNTGSDPVTNVAIACTFSDDGGTSLETGNASIVEIAGGATTRSEVIYYGWPRAQHVRCHIIPPR